LAVEGAAADSEPQKAIPQQVRLEGRQITSCPNLQKSFETYFLITT